MAAWVIECFDWFDARFPLPPKPILPTKEFFGARDGQDHETAEAVLRDIKRLMHFDLPIDLIPLARPNAEHRHNYQSMGDVAGMFQETEDGRAIHYDPEAMKRPVAFISTMSHEVMHARPAGLTDMVPGGHDAHELATDLGCIIAGFGVFQLKAADELGWSGFMTQETRGFALAYFLDQRGMGADTVASHLSGRCRKYLKRGFKDLAQVSRL